MHPLVTGTNFVVAIGSRKTWECKFNVNVKEEGGGGLT